MGACITCAQQVDQSTFEKVYHINDKNHLDIYYITLLSKPVSRILTSTAVPLQPPRRIPVAAKHEPLTSTDQYSFYQVTRNKVIVHILRPNLGKLQLRFGGHHVSLPQICTGPTPRCPQQICFEPFRKGQYSWLEFLLVPEVSGTCRKAARSSRGHGICACDSRDIFCRSKSGLSSVSS